MSQTPSVFINNPVATAVYHAPWWGSCVPNSGTSWTARVRAWSGTNGSGSLVTRTLTAYNYDINNNIVRNSHTDPGVNTEDANSSAGTNGATSFWAEGSFTGAAIGSLEIFAIYTGVGFIPGNITFSPDHGAVGNAITISGIRFTDATGVWFNGTGDNTFVVLNDTTITAHVPNGATSGQVQVGNPAGSTLSAASFTVVPPPTVSSASPNVGTSGTVVTVTGTNLTYTTGVTIGGAAASFSVTDDSHLSVTVPSGAAAGVGSLVVTTIAGNASVSFTVGQIFFGAVPSSLVAVWLSTGGAPVKIPGVWVSNGAGGVKRIW